MSRPVIYALIITLVTILWIGSGFITNEKPAEPQSVQEAKENAAGEKALKKVQYRISREEKMRRALTLTGRTKASRLVELSAEIDGRISNITAKRGDFITAGTPLLKIEVNQRSAELKRAEQNLNAAQIEYEAEKNLFDRGFGTKTALASKTAQLEAAKADAEIARLNLNNTTVRAPFDGTLAERVVENGSFVRSGDRLLTLVDLDPIYVSIAISESDITQIKLGQNAKISLPHSDRTYLGQVSYISPVADITTRTYAVEMTVDNKDGALSDGLTAEVHIESQDQVAHKISPSALSLADDGTIGVKILDEQNKVRFMPITILSTQSDAMYIKGLSPEVKLITIGQEFVIEGETVEPVLSQGQKGLM